MYQNIFYDRNNYKVHIWDDKKGHYIVPYQNYAYIKDPRGQLYALDGNPVKKIKRWSKEDEAKGIIYESDITPETRTLVDIYGDSDEVSENHRVLFFDIEVESKGGFPVPEQAANPITSIAYYDVQTKMTVCLLLDPDRKMEDKITDDFCLYRYDSEEELLLDFIQKFRDIDPTVISGWNSDYFDVPYLYNRIKNVLGESSAKRLSPIGKVIFLKHIGIYRIAGVNSIDYMAIYKEFTRTSTGERPSYTLDFISNYELGRGKIKYDGTLDDLYEKDPEKFINYNVEDVILIKDMDEKLKFLTLAMAICHKGHVPYEDIHSTSRYLDGAALTYMKRVGVVAPNKPDMFKFEVAYPHRIGEDKLFLTRTIPDSIPKVGTLRVYKTKTSIERIKYIKCDGNTVYLEKPITFEIFPEYDMSMDLPGAFVQAPIPGRYEWIYDLDLTSLYPSIIMSLNISPETKMGRILDWSSDDFVRKIEREYHLQIKSSKKVFSTKELIEFLDTKNYSVAANGVMYRQDVPGFLPSILAKWFEDRSESKKKMNEWGKKGDMDKYNYYYLIQYVQKVMLNAFYGVLGLPVFRYYDIDNAEAITSSGQQVIKFTSKVVDQYYQRELGGDERHVIYTDTDSVFVSSLQIIKHKYPNLDIKDEKLMVEKTLEVAGDVQQYINKMYDVYAKHYHHIDKHRFEIKQEVISRSGFWVAKKRYAQMMIYKEGVPVDEIDVKGIDVVRSDFPTVYRSFMEKILIDILHAVEKDNIGNQIISFKETLKDQTIIDTMFNKSVKEITKYDYNDRDMFTYIKGTPAHVKAALNYNDLLKYYNLTNKPPFMNGEKIKWIYLKKNPFNLESVALKGFDDPPQIQKLVDDYVDHEKAFEKIFLNKIQDFYNALDWGKVVLNNKINEFFSF